MIIFHNYPKNLVKSFLTPLYPNQLVPPSRLKPPTTPPGDDSLVSVDPLTSPSISGVCVGASVGSVLGDSEGEGEALGEGVGVDMGVGVGVETGVGTGVGVGVEITGAGVYVVVDVLEPPHITISL